MSIDNLKYTNKRISNLAGILRHSDGTHMINNSAPLEVIQSLLGQEKSEITYMLNRMGN